ncbi:MAG: hypothetical protein SVY53_02790, partial [Chloroflexota bacterium]|nr:hypothetical protein [Chloroflexota bacterium]
VIIQEIGRAGNRALEHLTLGASHRPARTGDSSWLFRDARRRLRRERSAERLAGAEERSKPKGRSWVEL